MVVHTTKSLVLPLHRLVVLLLASLPRESLVLGLLTALGVLVSSSASPAAVATVGIAAPSISLPSPSSGAEILLLLLHLLNLLGGGSGPWLDGSIFIPMPYRFALVVYRPALTGWLLLMHHLRRRLVLSYGIDRGLARQEYSRHLYLQIVDGPLERLSIQAGLCRVRPFLSCCGREAFHRTLEVM